MKEPDGRLYSGEFKDGLPDGYGIQEDPSGVRYMGYWSKAYGMEWEQSILVMVQILQVSLAVVWLLTVNMTGVMEGLPIHLKMKMVIGLIDKYA